MLLTRGHTTNGKLSHEWCNTSPKPSHQHHQLMMTTSVSLQDCDHYMWVIIYARFLKHVFNCLILAFCVNLLDSDICIVIGHGSLSWREWISYRSAGEVETIDHPWRNDWSCSIYYLGTDHLLFDVFYMDVIFEPIKVSYQNTLFMHSITDINIFGIFLVFDIFT